MEASAIESVCSTVDTSQRCYVILTIQDIAHDRLLHIKISLVEVVHVFWLDLIHFKNNIMHVTLWSNQNKYKLHCVHIQQRYVSNTTTCILEIVRQLLHVR